MLTIDGKTIITTDWHFGVNQNRVTKLKILSMAVEKINRFKNSNKVRNLVFGGDMFHQRNNLSIETINVAIALMERIAEKCNVYLILGNHDIFNKNSNSINSVKIFKHIRNVNIIESATECSINGNKTLLVPWNTDLSQIKRNFYDMMIGHFDISTQYLIESYIENNIRKNISREESIKKLNEDNFLRDSDLDGLDFEVENTTDDIVHGKSSSELIGNWTEIVKKKGVIFSGHIHGHKEFYTNNRRFIFIGSPYQQTLGEIDSEDGFYTLDEKNAIEFHRLEGIPVHKEIKISEILKDLDNFDYSQITGNILHRIYDVEVNNVTDAKITQKIIDFKPYEELPPDYSSQVSYSDEKGNESSVDLIRKSKLDYLRGYINNMDKKIIEDDGIDRNRLYDVMKDYYDQVNEAL